MGRTFVYTALVAALVLLAFAGGSARASVGSERQVLGAADPQFADPLAQEAQIEQLSSSSSEQTVRTIFKHVARLRHLRERLGAGHLRSVLQGDTWAERHVPRL